MATATKTALELLCEVREFEAQVGGSLVQTAALSVLRSQGSMTIGQLAERLSRACPTLTDLVDRLERHGLVRRVRSAEDRRVVLVELVQQKCAEASGR